SDIFKTVAVGLGPVCVSGRQRSDDSLIRGDCLCRRTAKHVPRSIWARGSHDGSCRAHRVAAAGTESALRPLSSPRALVPMPQRVSSEDSSTRTAYADVDGW